MKMDEGTPDKESKEETLEGRIDEGTEIYVLSIPQNKDGYTGNVILGLYSTRKKAGDAADSRHRDLMFEQDGVARSTPPDITPITIGKLLELGAQYTARKIKRFGAPLSSGLPKSKYPWLQTYRSVGDITKQLDEKPIYETQYNLEVRDEGVFGMLLRRDSQMEIGPLPFGENIFETPAQKAKRNSEVREALKDMIAAIENSSS
jgi:hypothetical protein